MFFPTRFVLDVLRSDTTGWVDRGRLDFGSSADKYSIFVGCHRHTKNCRDSHGHFLF